MTIAVVGAGIVGSCTAFQLAKRGQQVTIFDQHEPFHTLGSSHGNSRIVRRAYPDPFYTAVMQEGYPLWRELELASGETLVQECGLAYFGAASSPTLLEMVQGLTALDVEYRVYEAYDVGEVFPALKLDRGEVAVFTPEAGYAGARASVRAALKVAASLGADIQIQKIEDLTNLEAEFDAIALCPGAWIKKFVDLEVKVTCETYAYVQVDQSGPVWIEDDPSHLYGFPTELKGSGIKIGVHQSGIEIDPDIPSRSPSLESLERIKAFAESRFGLSKPDLEREGGCLYTTTSNQDFKFGRLGDKIVWASPCSGHGFKFGPWSGKFVADLIEGKRDLAEFPRFASTAQRVR